MSTKHFARCFGMGLCWVLAGQLQSVEAQLTVLSRGNTDLKWQQTQVALLEQQLADRTIKGDLRLELEAQAKWLKAWRPGSLKATPLLESKAKSKIMVEPVIDPNEVAEKLRERLLGPNARPTVKDTKALEKLLEERSGDVGVRQLHLHWLDQKIYRKQYPEEIADAAIRLFGLLEQIKPQSEKVEAAKAYCLYRRGRALAYRELPDVVSEKPIDDPEAHAAKLFGAYSQLTTLVGSGRPEFILLDIRMLRRDQWHGRALQLVENHGELIEKQWFLKKRRDILKDLGWEKPYAEAAAIYAEQYPDAVEDESDV